MKHFISGKIMERRRIFSFFPIPNSNNWSNNADKNTCPIRRVKVLLLLYHRKYRKTTEIYIKM